MLLKLAAAVVVVGAVPAAVFAVGGLPSGPRDDVVPYETRTVGAEEQWRANVGAICTWELKQGQAFNRAFRRAATPVDIEFMFKSLIRLNDESRAIFSRLDVPLEFRREADDLLRYIKQERAGLQDALRAFKARRRAAFSRAVRRFVQADTRSAALLGQLGIDRCRLKPVRVPDTNRAPIV